MNTMEDETAGGMEPTLRTLSGTVEFPLFFVLQQGCYVNRNVNVMTESSLKGDGSCFHDALTPC